MSTPQNLPEILQARLKLGLFNWGKRTVIWTLALGLVSTMAPGLKFLLIGWLLFSAISLAALLLGLKLASNLKTGTSTGFDPTGNQPRDVGGTRPETAEQETAPPRPHGASRRRPAGQEVIEIEAEVLPPENR